MTMKGISIHIGLNFVDPHKYEGWNGALNACENDARDMRQIADNRGFVSKLITSKDATADKVIDEIASAAQNLKSGDILFLSYSGHGSQIPDTSDDETDGLDETWVLFDRMLIDDEIYAAWSKFAPGVRILVLSDSCNSGTVLREYGEFSTLSKVASRFKTEKPVFRAMPSAVSETVYKKQIDRYKSIQTEFRRGDKVEVKASFLLLSGCQDNQSSQDGDINGLFTEMLKKVWDNGRFAGNYKSFWRSISRGMPVFQSPNYFKIGVESLSFEAEKPFTI